MDNSPTAENYEKSYMHRDTITHLIITWFVFRNIGGMDFMYLSFLMFTDFVIAARADGHVKFWKNGDDGIEFVKHFRTHLGVRTAFFICHPENCRASFLAMVWLFGLTIELI